MVHPVTISEVMAFAQTHGYWVLFLLMLAEGPIVTSAAAFMASFHIFNIYLVFALSFLGNQTGDLLFYFLGRFGRKSMIDRYMEKKKVSLRTVSRIEKMLEDNYFRALLVIKLVPSLPIPGLIFSGAGRLKLKKFLFASIVINLFYCLAFTLLGYYSGFIFGRYVLNARRLEIFIGVAVIIAVAIWVYRKYSSGFYKEIGEMEKN